MRRTAKVAGSFGVLGLLVSGLLSAAPAAPATAAGGETAGAQQTRSGTAAAPALISRSIYLTEKAHTGTAKLPATAPRVIDLAGGVYLWSVYLSDSDLAFPFEVERRIPKDTYNWRCYLSGTGLPWDPDEYNFNYAGNCLLDPANPDLPSIWLPGTSGKLNYTRYKGTFYWESKLVYLRQ